MKASLGSRFTDSFAYVDGIQWHLIDLEFTYTTAYTVYTNVVTILPLFFCNTVKISAVDGQKYKFFGRKKNRSYTHYAFQSVYMAVCLMFSFNT